MGEQQMTSWNCSWSPTTVQFLQFNTTIVLDLVRQQKWPYGKVLKLVKYAKKLVEKDPNPTPLPTLVLYMVLYANSHTIHEVIGARGIGAQPIDIFALRIAAPHA